jgi:hypothetical protein
MNLKSAPFKLEIEFRLQPSHRFEADVAERADVVREHHDLQSHRTTPIAHNIRPPFDRRQKRRARVAFCHFPQCRSYVN